MYEIKTEDAYKDFSNNKVMLDFSNYSTKSKDYNNSNKLVIGKMKDETGGVAIEEFVGLKPKMYSFLVGNNKNKKGKGLMKPETGGVAIEEFVGLKPKMYSFLAGNDEYKNGNSFNKNVVATISHNEYKDVLLNKKCIRHSMN